MMELLERIAAHAVHQGEAIAIRQADGPAAAALTYGQLHEEIGRVGRVLRERFGRGAVVMLLCGNRPGFWVGYFSALAAGLSVFPASCEMVPAELATAVMRSAAAGVMVEDRVLAAVRQVFGPAEELVIGNGLTLLVLTGEQKAQPGAGLLLQSSGTTGRARIAWRSAASLDAMARNMCGRIGFEPHDRVLTGMPLGHSYGGEHGVLAPAWGGASVHVCSGVQLPVIARELRESGITMLPGVPFLFEIMAQASEAIPRLGHLRHAFSAGAQLPRAVYDAFVARFGLPIGQIYGATEMGTVTFNDPSRRGFDPSSVGLPLEGVEIRVLDAQNPEITRPLPAGVEGQVVVKAPTQLSHAVGEAAGEFMDGFVVTGDLGKLDGDGALEITGRLRLLIDVGGRKVNPVEVEQVIRRHPKVTECVIVPVKASLTVSRLKAVVVPRGEVDAGDEEAIRTFAREQLSAYKVPRRVEFRQTLPRTPLGKILRHQLEEE